MRMIPLVNGGFAKVDDDVFELLVVKSWFRHAKGHAQRTVIDSNGRHGTVYMHRLVMNAPAGVMVDHKDRDKLNNQRDNLRLCNNTQNQGNRAVNKNKTTSRHKGVALRISPNGYRRFVARISVNGQRIQLGSFANEEEAAKAYNKAAINHFGEFALLNEV